MVRAANFVPLDFERMDIGEQERRLRVHRALARRRSVRAFSPDPVPRQLVVEAIRAAGHSPLRRQPPALALRSGGIPGDQAQDP